MISVADESQCTYYHAEAEDEVKAGAVVGVKFFQVGMARHLLRKRVGWLLTLMFLEIIG